MSLAASRQDWVKPIGATSEALTALEAAMFSFAEVLAEALAVLAEAGGVHTAVSPSPDPLPDVAALSPRERQVLALVAEGHTNKTIAERLYVSPNTIKTHVASLLTKLQVDSRVQLAAIAARQRLG